MERRQEQIEDNISKEIIDCVSEVMERLDKEAKLDRISAAASVFLSVVMDIEDKNTQLNLVEAITNELMYVVDSQFHINPMNNKLN